MQQEQLTETEAGAAAAVAAPELWSTAGIVMWSLLFTPAFGAWLQVYNYRRMGDAARAQRAWYWCLAGLGVLGWNALACAFELRLGFDASLLGWTNGALFIAWLGTAVPEHATAVKDSWGDGYRRRQWDSVAVLGLLAAVAYLGASSVLQWVLVNLA